MGAVYLWQYLVGKTAQRKRENLVDWVQGVGRIGVDVSGKGKRYPNFQRDRQNAIQIRTAPPSQITMAMALDISKYDSATYKIAIENRCHRYHYRPNNETQLQESHCEILNYREWNNNIQKIAPEPRGPVTLKLVDTTSSNVHIEKYLRRHFYYQGN